MILKRLRCSTVLCICSMFLFACTAEELAGLASNSDDESTSSPDTVDLLISWDDNSDNESEFLIERRVASSADYGTVYHVVENSTSYNDLQVKSGETYCYRITASNNIGDSPSSEVCIDV